jgi:hypothetical protein
MSNDGSTADRRVNVIEAVKTPLGFFVLVVLVVEVFLGVVAGLSTGNTATITVVGMLVIILALIAVVAYLAHSRPEALAGVRPSAAVASHDELHGFCRRVAGTWWSYRADPASVGFVVLAHDELSGTLSLHGRAYAADGVVVSVWEATASCVHLKAKKLYYYWTGHHPARPAEPCEGFGEISFHDSASRAESATGLYSDTNLTNVTSTTKKSSDFRRCTDEEAGVMMGGDRQRIAGLVQNKLKRE